MMLHFIVPGEPCGKGRHRFARRGDYVKAYTPKKTVNYENLVKLEYSRQCGDAFFDKDVPVEMVVRAYYSIPKSVSAKKHTQMVLNKIRPIKKPDTTNVLKAIEDALNRVAYYDDTQIVETHASRFYAENPRVEVWLDEVRS